MSGKPEFATNLDNQTVAGALTEFIDHAATQFVGGSRLDIATAYFNVGGFSLIADAVEKLNGARLLLGAEPTPPENRQRKLGAEPKGAASRERAKLGSALADNESCILVERDMLGFSYEADTQTRRLIEWLRSDGVEVRRLEDRFLHGKAFLVSDRSHGVVVGSSNFTYAGLARNLELNLGNYQTHVVDQVSGWFDGLWDHAASYDLAGLFENRFEPHLPYLIYLRMLWELYGADLDTDDATKTDRATQLTEFQSHGVDRAKRILKRYGGVLVADEVGLGKTFLAGELIREASEQQRQHVLVITPATLRDGPWRVFRKQQSLSMELISYDDLLSDTDLNPEGGHHNKLSFNVNQYALVVIDEAHNMRNPSTQRAEALRRLLAGSPPKKLVMLTATPVNNSVWDLYYLLAYFLRNDAAFADSGIRSLRDHFHEAASADPGDLSPEHLFDVLDAVAVRRTRSFVKEFYANDTVRIGGQQHHIVFPTPVVRKVDYDLDSVMPGFFDEFAEALDPDANPNNEGVLTLARYAPSQYRKTGDVNANERQLTGLLRSGLLKRFESSPYAFANTCTKMADSCRDFVSLLDRGLVATGCALADWAASDSDELDECFERIEDEAERVSKFKAGLLRDHAIKDERLLRSFAAKATRVQRSNDPNLTALVDELAFIAAEADREGIGDDDTRNRRKVLIFSYYADTVEWIIRHLEHALGTDPRLAVYRGRIESVSGSDGDRAKAAALHGFAPITTDAEETQEDLYDILVATDVLAEGVNLQQARHIINYDLPWNPMRLVQRHGRIDRIGSKHDRVYLRCVFPDKRLDDLLKLEEKLHHKIAQAAASIGVGTVIPDQKDQREADFADTREEIERIHDEDSALFERGGTAKGVLSGEEYRQELRRALADPLLAEKVKTLPWGSGSGMQAADTEAGYVFCAKVGDHPKPVFRFVPVDDHKPVSETQICLDAAHPPNGMDTPRELQSTAESGAFKAWATARASILSDWNYMADKANLEPRIAPRLKAAADLVRRHHPSDMPQDAVERAIDTIQAPHAERTIRAIHKASKGSETQTKERVEAILKEVDRLGLQPYTPPEPLPPIGDDDIHLVVWIAVGAA